MTNGIIFDTKEAAQDWDWQNNNFKGSITAYKWDCLPLTQTTTLTKAEYAEVKGIPLVINSYNEETHEAEQVANPEYEALDDTYVVNKHALVETEDGTFAQFKEFDEEDNFTGYSVDVVDVSELLLKSEGE